MKSWVDKKDVYVSFAHTRHQTALLVTKDAWPWKIAAVCAAIFVGYRGFLTSWATTFGPLMGYPRAFLRLSRRLLVHECWHSSQCESLGWYVPVVGWFFGPHVRTWAGLLPFALLWGLGGLPFFFCSGRFFLELGADRHAWGWMLRNGYSPDDVRTRGMAFADKVCGRQYGWSLLFIGKWLFRRAIEKEIRRAAQRSLK